MTGQPEEEGGAIPSPPADEALAPYLRRGNLHVTKLAREDRETWGALWRYLKASAPETASLLRDDSTMNSLRAIFEPEIVIPWPPEE